MTHDLFEDLFHKYLESKCTREELVQLLDALKHHEYQELASGAIVEQLARPQMVTANGAELQELQQKLDKRLSQIYQQIDQKDRDTTTYQRTMSMAGRGRRRLVWAAAAILILCIGVYFWKIQADNTVLQPPKQANTGDFKPGMTAATLIVEGGREISLDSSSIQKISVGQGAAILSNNGQIQYNNIGTAPNKLVFNTLRTSNGNQFRLVLPDGTKVWLNAASSIRYPVSFVGSKREVEVQGEVYFEVMHNDRQPFIVRANGHKIEDLGTSFNVHAYPTEHSVSTTLIEGVVKIGHRVLKPGEQALIKDGIMKVQTVDTSLVVAWKNGYFAFRQTPVKEVMRQLSRWYNVEVSYEGEIPDMRFGGKISRYANASVALTILRKTGLEFKVEGRKITVTGEKQR